MSDSISIDRRQLLKGSAALAGGVALGGASIVQAAHPAHAASAPTIYTRANWNARPPTTTPTILDHGPDHLIVHHTATANVTDYSKSAAFSLSRSIQNLHMNTNGWIDIGEQLTISRGGYIMEGRDRTLESFSEKLLVLGAQCANNNSHTLGIENEGTYTSVTPPKALYNSLVATLAYLCDLYGLDPSTAIVGHRDYNDTECPGDKLYAMLPQIRKDVAGKLDTPARRLVRPKRVPAPSWAHHSFGPPRHTFDHGPAVGKKDPIPH